MIHTILGKWTARMHTVLLYNMHDTGNIPTSNHVLFLHIYFSSIFGLSEMSAYPDGLFMPTYSWLFLQITTPFSKLKLAQLHRLTLKPENFSWLFSLHSLRSAQIRGCHARVPAFRKRKSLRSASGGSRHAFLHAISSRQDTRDKVLVEVNCRAKPLRSSLNILVDRGT